MALIGTLEPIEVHSLDPGDNLLQSAFWAGFKQRHGWKPFAFRDPDSGVTLLVLTRQFAGGMTLAYVPHAPDEQMLGSLSSGALVGTGAVSPKILADLLTEISSQISPFLPSRTFLIRFDPRVPFYPTSDLNHEGGNAHGSGFSSPGEERDGAIAPTGVTSDGLGPEPSPELVSSACARCSRALLSGAVDVQPPTTVLIDIGRDDAEILADMKSKWRYNIRLTAKRGVTVRASNAKTFERDISRWYALYEETAKRDTISIHSEAYYRDFIEHAWYRGAGPGVDLLVAEHDGDLLAGIITARMGNRATYVFGASASFKRNLMPAYALQWAAIGRAKRAGCSAYDMYGIPPAESSDHPMHGLYRFKTGFGGDIVTYPGTLDLVIRPVAARAFRGVERVRNYYFKRLKKR